MTSTLNVVLCAAVATVLWTAVGLSIARCIAPRSLAWPIAPLLGWAVHSAIVLPVFLLTGLSRPSVWVGFGLALLAALVGLARQSREAPQDEARVPAWLLFGAALVALIPAAAILPKAVA